MFNLSESLSHQKHWLVTGAAGFIGSNLCEFLLKSGQRVTAMDNYLTGHPHNIVDIQKVAADLGASNNFTFLEADIRKFEDCTRAVQNIDVVLHQAALGSVPRSINNPIASHEVNVDGFLNMLKASVDGSIKRFVYASSSSVYGDSPDLPKVESKTGNILSPYAATKAINELYASVFQRNYGIQCIGLRYFNVFGRRQDPNGPYAAVIPKWLSALLSNTPVIINGDGLTSRDFCYIDNVIQANIRAALAPLSEPKAEVFNIAFGEKTELNELAAMLRSGLARAMNVPIEQLTSPIQHSDFRAGDIRHSLASTQAAKALLGYDPKHSLADGLTETCSWYLDHKDRLN
jgi:UDP-N-acetylglucosamine/UDP-N-acetylgalactosamine 4-epimerase